MTTEIPHSTPTYFNTIYRDFVKEIAETFPEYKMTVIKQYKDLLNDKKELENDIYMTEYMSVVKDYIEAIVDNDDTIFDTNDALYFLREIDFCYIWKLKMTDNTKQQIRKYLKTLYIIGTKIVSTSSDISNIIDDFYNKEGINLETLDEEAKKMVKLLESVMPSVDEDGFTEDYEKIIKNSSIGKLAQEIASEINFDDIPVDTIETPSDIMKNLMGDGLINIVQNVGTKIQNKLSSGQLDSEKLLGEAQQMMSMMGGTQFQDLFQNIASQVTTSGLGRPNPSSSSRSGTRERLRKKLEDRRRKNKKEE